MTDQELKQMAQEVHDAVYGGLMSTESIVARVMNYVLIKEKEARKETAKNIVGEIDGFVDYCFRQEGEISPSGLGKLLRSIETDFDLEEQE